jgi:hypothetical protein
MKIIQPPIKSILFTILLMINGVTLCSSNTLKRIIDPPNLKTISFKIKLKTAEKVKIQAAALKFNKHLAYSFTLDDGYRSAYLTAFPLLNGGKVSPKMINEWKNDQVGDGSHSNGLFYSDGLGNKIPFKLGLAINGGAIGDFSAYRGHLSWAEVKDMYDAGWDILNHGFHHATKHGTDFLTEVTENTSSIKQNLGFTMSQFVVPGGESDPGYQLEYERDALANGSFSVASYAGAGPVIKVDQKVNLDKMIYARTFVQSSKDTIGFKTMDRFLATFDSVAKLSDPIWYNEFTHGVGNGNLWSLSMRFPDFKYYMTAISNKYGSKGNDSIWMAPWQEVYEYIWLRDRIKINYEQKDKEVLVTIELPEIPETFRYRAISLIIDTLSKFEIESNSNDFSIYSDGKVKHSLINLQLK